MLNSGRKNGYQVEWLGIDFGSSKTSIVGMINENGKLMPVYFRNGKSVKFDTVMGVKRNGEDEDKRFFADTFAADFSAEWKVFDSLKEEFCIDSDLEIRTRDFFGAVLEKCKTQGNITYDFSQLKGITFGHPAYYEPGAQKKYCAKLKGILSEVFKIEQDKIQGYPEPVLASAAYQKSYGIVDGVKKNDVILVLDFGGFTMDIAVVQVTNHNDNKLELKQKAPSGSLPSSRVFMGKRMTDELCKEIYQSYEIHFDPAIEAAKCNAFSNPSAQPDVKSLKYTWPLPTGANQRFAVSYDEVANKQNGVTYVSLNGKKFNVEGKFVECYDYIKEYLDDCNVKEVNYVLFSGGTANIAQLRDYIIRKLKEDNCLSENLVVGETQTDDLSKRELWIDRKYRTASKVTICNASDIDAFRQLGKIIDGSDVEVSSDNVVAYGAAMLACGSIKVGDCKNLKVSNNAKSNAELIENYESERIRLKGLFLKINSVITRAHQKLKEFKKGNLSAEEMKREAGELVDFMEEKFPKLK